MSKLIITVYGGADAIPRPLIDAMANEIGANDWEYIHIPKECPLCKPSQHKNKVSDRCLFCNGTGIDNTAVTA